MAGTDGEGKRDVSVLCVCEIKLMYEVSVLTGTRPCQGSREKRVCGGVIAGGSNLTLTCWSLLVIPRRNPELSLRVPHPC